MRTLDAARRLIRALALAAAGVSLAAPGAAAEDGAGCGRVSLGSLDWASAEITTAIASRVLSAGYGCDVRVVATTTIAALKGFERGDGPDVVIEFWLNAAGPRVAALEAEGRLERLGSSLAPGGVEGWWITAETAVDRPELTRIDAILADPDSVGAVFHSCPVDWGCHAINANLARAFALSDAGIAVIAHPDGSALDASLHAAVAAGAPWFGYAYGPSAAFARHRLIRVDLGPYDPAGHRANQVPDAPAPARSDFPSAPVATLAMRGFAARAPTAAAFLSALRLEVGEMSALLDQQAASAASAQEIADAFLAQHPETWHPWVAEEARSRLLAALKQRP
ncbi:MAG: glycine betaine ABC transporter substrate-binding protein [Pseudomonadota bacterium]